MAVLSNLSIGFVGAFIGVLLPGLLNVYALKVSLSEGRQKAVVFTAGVSVTVIIQATLALVFARYLDRHPEIISVLQKVALVVFLGLTGYFLFIAKDTRREVKEQKSQSKTNRFFTGMFLALLNLLPLPYWVYIGITFSGFGWFSFALPDLYFASLGAGIGTFVGLLGYVFMGREREKSKPAKVNMNLIIGLITGVISLITLFKILKIF